MKRPPRLRTSRFEWCEPRRVLSLTVPALSSLPGAPATIYLDFDGNFESQWGSYQNVSTPAYDTDGNPSDFSSQEIAEITDIWAGVVEDFAPFNINVTTVDPGDFSNGVGLRVAIGGSYSDWYGVAASGVSFIYSFINPLPNTVFVFEDNLSVPRQVADIASHEAGHAFGLFHQSVWENGVKTEEFNPGNPPNWGPIMGNPLFSVRSTWFNGTTTSPNTFQDDMAMIASPSNGFGYRADDYGDDLLTATSLTPTGSTISASGIVGQMTDVDVFSFSTGAGQIDLTVDVAPFGPNLDATLELQDAAGTVIASAAPSGSLSASISTVVPSGVYYAVVGSQGNYGDVGQYTLSGTIVPVGNQNPTADVGGPYTINEGDSLALDASGSFDPDAGDVLTFDWDVNGDGVFGDASGANPVLSWSQLVGLGIDDGFQVFNVTVRVDDGNGGTDEATTTLTVQNVAPVAGISGPSSAVPGQTRSYVLTATDASPADQAAGFTFRIDWDGDGTTDETVVGGSGTSVEHVFTDVATVNVSVTVEDRDLASSQPATTQTDVTRFALQPDENDPSVIHLAWGGSEGFDVVFFLPQVQGGIGIFAYAVDSVVVGTFDVVTGVNGSILAYGLGFGDVIVANALSIPVLFDGGAGDDLLIGGSSNDTLFGGSGDDTMVGGAGDDQIFANDGDDLLFGDAGDDLLIADAGRDLVVGGEGFDFLDGGEDADILIAGSESLDLYGGEWGSIQSQWLSPAAYMSRINQILGGGGGNNQANLEPGDNLLDDETVDVLFGDGELDWFIASLQGDVVLDPETGEVITEIDP